jgi:nicotinate-nucleotide adenylyltransferase
MTRWYPGPPSRFARRSVGLLGGSFNPAHDGHRHVAEAALQCLGLDEVWLLVSPQNPLKTGAEMAPLGVRTEAAIGVARDPRVRVTDIETALGTTYTAEALAALRQRYPRLRFVWLMGADNLIQLPAWKDWSEIFHTVGVAVFARPSYSIRALTGVAARRFSRYRLPERHARRVPGTDPPVWVFIHTKLHPASASAIRAAARGPVEGARTAPGR